MKDVDYRIFERESLAGLNTSGHIYETRGAILFEITTEPIERFYGTVGTKCKVATVLTCQALL